MFHFPLHALTDREAENPHAYAIGIHKRAYRALELLRMIYWPQNAYCIHVDLTSSKAYYSIFENLSNCYPNIILPKRRSNVKWGKQAENFRTEADKSELIDPLIFMG